MEGSVLKPEIPFGLEAQLRQVRETQRAFRGALGGQILREGGFGPSGAFTARGMLDPSLGAFDAFQADHEKNLDSIRSLVRGVGFSVRSDLISGTPEFADIARGFHEDIAKTARMVGHGGLLSETVEDAAQNALRSARFESKAIGIAPDFVRDASSIAFGRSGRTRDPLGDDRLAALGVSGKRWGEQLDMLTRGLAPMVSAENMKAVTGLRGALAGQTDFGKASRDVATTIRGITPGPGVADRFDFSSFLSGHLRGAEGLSSLIGGGIVDQAQVEKLSRTALSLAGAFTPNLPEMTRGICSNPSVASALELNSVLGADAAKKLPIFDLAGFGTLGLDPLLSRGVLAGFGVDMATNYKAWTNLHGLARVDWSELRTAVEATLETSFTDVVDEPGADHEEQGETFGAADRLREMGMWLPAHRRRDVAFLFSFLSSINTVSEAMAARGPRQMFFAVLSLVALSFTWPDGPKDRD